jgi:hypothetical protein
MDLLLLPAFCCDPFSFNTSDDEDEIDGNDPSEAKKGS